MLEGLSGNDEKRTEVFSQIDTLYADNQLRTYSFIHRIIFTNHSTPTRLIEQIIQ